MSTPTEQETQILRMVKKVLTDIAKETFTRPGYRHPLSDNTILGIRECLSLIAAREGELAEANGQGQEMRPRFIDEPKSGPVVVSLDSLRKTDTGPKE